MANMPQIIIGILLLSAGCRLFWVFVGGLGFVAGMQISMAYFAPEPEWIIWVVALLCGTVGALIAIFFQTLAIGVAGFVAGVTITSYLLALMGQNAPAMYPLVGGVVCLILLYLTFDWALIGLSAVAGASLIVQNFHLNQQLQFVLYVALVAIGIFIQANIATGRQPAKR